MTSKTQSKNPPSKKNKAVNLLILIIFVAGLSIFLYPMVSNAINRHQNAVAIAGYQSKVHRLSKARRQKILNEARTYNAQHTVNSIEDDVFDKNNHDVLHHPYDTLLNPTGDEIMGYLRIPKIHLRLAIYHGTSDKVLKKGVGHVQGTSLPVGGPSTHAVLAAHRGLPSAKLFTDLDKMKKGDHFYITVVGETHAYTVDQIKVVKPDKVSVLNIVPGMDLVTLLTCTPYGVNTHRLLIRGHRIPYTPIKEGFDWDRWWPLFAAIALVVLAVILIYRTIKKRKN
jgi:sortase A